MHRYRSGFTLIELLVVIAIVAVLAVVVVLVLNPAQLLMQARDSNRLSDLVTINSALGYLRTDQPSASLGNSSTSYISVLDPSATSTAGDQCQGIGMPSLGSSTWQCASSSTYRKSDGTGWIPVALSAISYGTPLAQLPSDPVNATSSNLFYSYSTNGSQYEVTAVLESSKYKTQFGSQSQIPGYPEVAAQGSSFTLSPMWNPGGLVGYWPMDEGSGSTALDKSGNGDVGIWSGSLPYYAGGKVGPYAGNFDGNTNYVGMPGVSSVFAGLTVSTWVNSSVPLNSATSTALIEGSSSPYSSFRINGGSLALRIDSWGSTGAVYWALPASYQNQWTMFSGTWDSVGQVLRLYANGVLVATQTGVTSPAQSLNSPASIGKYLPSSANLFQGFIDDIRIYNRALSAAEIQALYNAER